MLSPPIVCPWKIFILRGETESLLGRMKFLVVGSSRWLSWFIVGSGYIASYSLMPRPLPSVFRVCLKAIGDSDAFAATALESYIVFFLKAGRSRTPFIRSNSTLLACIISLALSLRYFRGPCGEILTICLPLPKSTKGLDSASRFLCLKNACASQSFSRSLFGPLSMVSVLRIYLKQSTNKFY